MHDLRESKTPVAIFLVNGIRLQGQIDFFDTYVDAVKSTFKQLVYRHVISTVVPAGGKFLQVVQERPNASKPVVVVRTKPFKG